MSGVAKMRNHFAIFLSHMGPDSVVYPLGGVVALPQKQNRLWSLSGAKTLSDKDTQKWFAN